MLTEEELVAIARSLAGGLELNVGDARRVVAALVAARAELAAAVSALVEIEDVLRARREARLRR